jgi:hypothetical protein
MRLDFMTSCKRFGICPKHRVSRGVALRPWQAQDMAWISSMLDSDVHYALLANDVGTGKTISALASLTGMVRNTQKLVAQGELRPVEKTECNDMSVHNITTGPEIETPQETSSPPDTKIDNSVEPASVIDATIY